jgi:F-type H+-transporting ATPase subunit delta
MRGTSRVSREAGIEAFEPVAVAAGDDARLLAEGLFTVVNALDSSGSLRRTLTDPARPGTDKGTLVSTLFHGLDPRVQGVVSDFASRRWWHEEDLGDALEDTAVEALLIFAQANGSLDAVEGELFAIERLLHANLDLYSALDNRAALPGARIRLAETLIGPRVSPVTKALIDRAATTTRGHRLAKKLSFYSKAAAERRNRMLARVTVAAPLSEDRLRRLESVLRERCGRGVTIAVTIDPGIIGGIRVQIGHEVVDGTLRTRLETARAQLVG